jgi:hypothetical protein
VDLRAGEKKVKKGRAVSYAGKSIMFVQFVVGHFND